MFRKNSDIFQNFGQVKLVGSIIKAVFPNFCAKIALLNLLGQVAQILFAWPKNNLFRCQIIYYFVTETRKFNIWKRKNHNIFCKISSIFWYKIFDKNDLVIVSLSLDSTLRKSKNLINFFTIFQARSYI